MKTAIVHDWFTEYAGSEKCVESFTNIWRDADIYTIADFLNDEDREIVLKGKQTNTSFVQNLPFAGKIFRNYFSLFPRAIEEFDLNGYELVLSSSHAFAKGVLTNANQLHITYCHTPIRYAWDLYHQYLKSAGLTKGIKAKIAKKMLHRIRIWDYTTANRPDYYIANSHHIRKRIKKIYGKDADVIYPPVDVNKFEFSSEKDNYYLIAARFVPYKKVDLVVEAFQKMPDKKLVIIGTGTQENKIKSLAGKNVELLPPQSFENLKKYMASAKAFIYAAEEDFGITIVEAQSAGTPVIAYKTGGASETVINGKTGLHFNIQAPEAISEKIIEFEKNSDNYNPEEIRNHSLKFSRERFEEEIKNFVDEKAGLFYNSR